MKVIRPIKIKPSDLIESTAIDTTPDWDINQTYQHGDRAVFEDEFGPSIYQSTQKNNKGNVPDQSPDDWVRRFATNWWAPFDGTVSTASMSENGYKCTFQPKGRFESIAIFGLRGVDVKIRVKLGDNEVFTKDVSLRGNRVTTGWKSYFFGEFDPVRDIVVRGIPPVGRSSIVEVEVVGVGQVGVGEILVGMFLDMGVVEHGAEHGSRSFTRITQNPFGDETLLKIKGAKRNSYQLRIPKNRHRLITNWLVELDGVSAVFIGSDDPDYEAFVVLGYLKDWFIAVDYPKYSLANIQINGLK